MNCPRRNPCHPLVCSALSTLSRRVGGDLILAPRFASGNDYTASRICSTGLTTGKRIRIRRIRS